MSLSESIKQYLTNGQPTKLLGARLRHARWLNRMLTRPPVHRGLRLRDYVVPIPLGEDGELSPEDKAWVQEQNERGTGLATLFENRWQHNLLVVPALLSPAGLRPHHKMAAAAFELIANLVRNEQFDLLATAGIPPEDLEGMAALFHNCWRSINRSRVDQLFQDLNLPYKELGGFPDGSDLQELHRQSLLDMALLMREECPRT